MPTYCHAPWAPLFSIHRSLHCIALAACHSCDGKKGALPNPFQIVRAAKFSCLAPKTVAFRSAYGVTSPFTTSAVSPKLDPSTRCCLQGDHPPCPRTRIFFIRWMTRTWIRRGTKSPSTRLNLTDKRFCRSIRGVRWRRRELRHPTTENTI